MTPSAARSETVSPSKAGKWMASSSSRAWASGGAVRPASGWTASAMRLKGTSWWAVAWATVPWARFSSSRKDGSPEETSVHSGSTLVK